jgi:cytochrome c oxidase cbb3-type subunit II
MRMTLGSTAAGAAIVVFSVIFAVVAMPVLVFHPTPSDIAEPYTALQLQGRSVYESDGCFYCHSQFIRPQDWNQPGVPDSNGRVAQAGDYAYQQTLLLGQHRNGPDLSQEGGVHPDDWQLAHFYDPRFVNPKSLMPQFSFLWTTNSDGSLKATPDLTALIAYVQNLGGKLADERYAEQLSQKQLFKNAITAAPNPQIQQLYGVQDSGGQWGDTNQKALLSVVPQKFWDLLDPVPPDDRSLIDGKTIFVTNCIGCHGVRGNGVGPADQFLNPYAYNFTSAANMQSGLSTSPGSLYEHILYGIKGTAMQPFGQDLTVQNIWDVVNYLYTIPAQYSRSSQSLDTLQPTENDFIQWAPSKEMADLLKVPEANSSTGTISTTTPTPTAYRENDYSIHLIG